MKTAGTLLIVLSALIALAAIGERFGPALQERGIPLQGAVDPWALWIPIGIAALVAGIALRRRAAAAGTGDDHRGSPPGENETASPANRSGAQPD